MPTANPLVSIIVRTKDRPVLLERALATIAAQTYRPLGAVVVNDGGRALERDRLRTVLGDVEAVFIEPDASGGRSRAANLGLEAATGVWIGFLDDDDELLPRHVQTLVTQAVLSGAPVVYGDCETLVRELGPDGEILAERSEGRFYLSRDFSPDVLRFENYIPLICVLFSRQSLAGVAGFDEELELFEDWDFYLRVAARHPFRRVPEITCRYVQWSRTAQIAFTGNVDGRAAYLRVLAKSGRPILDSEILAYYLAKQADARTAADRQRAVEREAAALRARVAALESGNEALEARSRDLAARVDELETLVQGIADSAAWKLLHTYRTRVKGAFAPEGSLRRRAYDAVLGAGRRRLPGATAPGAARPAQPVSPARPAPPPPAAGQPTAAPRETFAPPVRGEASGVPLMAVVSVVIPTLDAGPELRAVLQRLRSQQGLAEVEIVAVDSGSTDGTPALCREFGVELATFSGPRFNHGLARSQGAALTRGEFLVFMSQDAVPVGEDALARMARFLASEPTVAAASAREVPRSDADLFSCWQQWTFNEKILGYERDTAVGVGPGGLMALTPAERRKAAQVNNVFCCVRRSAFDQVGVRSLPFAEDLDFGLRLLEAGHRIGFMPSVAVIHSHRRPAVYHLKRLFVDWLAQVDLLGFEPQDWPQVGITSGAVLIGELAAACRRLGTALSALDPRGTPAEVEGRLHEALYAPGEGAEAGDEQTPLDALLADLASAVCGAGVAPPAPSRGAAMRDRFRHLAHELFDFAACHGDLSPPALDLRGSLLDLYGHMAGWCLADYVRSSERAGRDAEATVAIAGTLTGGV